MSKPIVATHPVPFRYRPPRSRSEWIGHATGSTPVEVREFGEAPAEVTRISGIPVVAAEGRAWMRFEHLSHWSLRSALEGVGAPALPGAPQGAIASYLRRSPLCRFHDGEGSRLGDVDPARGAPTEEDSGRAAEAVRRFVDDRIRLGGGDVYLRYERVLLAKREGAGLLVDFPDFPRQSDGARPWAHWHCPGYSAFSVGGEVGNPKARDASWKEHLQVPESLLGDDDAIWFANVLPGLALAGALRRTLAEDTDGEGRAEIRELAGILGALAGLGMTLSNDGDALRPALLRVSDAVERLATLYAEADDHLRESANMDRSDSYGHAAEVIRMLTIPRLDARCAPPSADVESLARLAF